MKMDSLGIISLIAVFLGLVALSGYLILADDSNKARTPGIAGRPPDKINSNEEILKNFSKTSDNIVEKVEVQNISFESQKYWDGFETVTINVEEFESAAANGNLSLRLLENDFEIQIKKISRLNGGKSYQYSGYVKDVPQSEATFYVSGELLSGSIKFEDLMYNIAVSSEIKDKKTVYIVFITDWKKDRERLKSWLNPLKYFSFGKKGDINVTPAMSPANLNSTYNLSGTAGTIRG